jgi:hypothetical protein
MNTVEHIVESYFRLCRKCFTYADVKVEGGNNRQIDLLAVSLVSGEQFHVECSVTHCERWCPTPAELVLAFEKKFSGIPPAREGSNTDSSRGKLYGGVIRTMHDRLGLDKTKIQWVWVCWAVQDPENLEVAVRDYHLRVGYLVKVLSFRDTILPELMVAVSTANYDDEVLRTFSLIKEWRRQTELQAVRRC